MYSHPRSFPPSSQRRSHLPFPKEKEKQRPSQGLLAPTSRTSSYNIPINDNPPRTSLFPFSQCSVFAILQRSAGIASFQAEKRESAAAGRRTHGRSLRAPSPRRPLASSSLTTAPALPSPKTFFVSSPRSVTPVRSNTVGDANGF